MPVDNSKRPDFTKAPDFPVAEDKPKKFCVTKMKMPHSEHISEAGMKVIRETNVYTFDSSGTWFDSVAKNIQRLTNLLNMIGGLVLRVFLGDGKGDEARLLNGKHAVLNLMGAEHVQLRSDTGCIVDAHYLDAAKFVERLEQLGGQRKRFELKVFPEETRIAKFKKAEEYSDLPERLSGQFTGIQFSKATASIDEVKKIVEAMGYFGTYWTCSEGADGIYLVRQDDIHKMNVGAWGRFELLATDLPDIKKEDAEERGTVLLSQGLFGMYEGNLSEAVTLALEGINVMMYNAPGKGMSEGLPDRENINASIDAAYHFLKEVKNIPDEKIVAKGLCFGAAPTAWLGRKYPHINLMLDQNPANFRDVVPTAVNILAQLIFPEKKVPDNFKDECYSLLANLLRNNRLVEGVGIAIFKGYNIAEDLSYNEGHRLVHVNIPHENAEGEMRGDEFLVPQHHPALLLDAAKSVEGKQIYFTVNPAGRHDQEWWNDNNWAFDMKGSTCFDQIIDFFKEAGIKRDVM